MAKRKPGKVIEKWQFSVNRQKIEVPVRMITGQHTKTVFVVDIEYGPSHFWEQSSDIDELKKKVNAWLRDVTTFEYENYFYVTFSGACKKPHCWEDGETLRPEDRGEAISNIEWYQYQVGTTAEGRKRYRDCSRRMNSGDWTGGHPEIGFNKSNVFHDHRPSMSALVPATPENETALRQLSEAFEALNEKLMKFMTPELIEANFTQMLQRLPLLGTTSSISLGPAQPT